MNVYNTQVARATRIQKTGNARPMQGITVKTLITSGAANNVISEATVNEQGIRLEFAQFGHFTSFDVIRSTASMASVADADLPTPIATGLKTMYYVDTSVAEGITYYYRVRVWRGSESFVSAERIIHASFTSAADTIIDLFALGQFGFGYDFGNRATLWQDVEGTIPAFEVGHAVARVDDLSGNSNHLIQETVARRPVLQQDEQGLYLWFDGSKSMYTAAPVNLNNTQKTSVFVNISRERFGVDEIIFETSSNYNGHAGGFFCAYDPQQPYITFSNAIPGYSQVRFASHDGGLFSVGVDLTQAAVYTALRRNKEPVTPGFLQTGSRTPLGTYVLYVGARGGTQYFAKAKYRQLVFYTDALTIAQFDVIDEALMQG